MSGLTPDWLLAGGIAGISGLLVFALLPPLIGWLRRRAVLDIPNHRSSHSEITPRGGGIAVSACILLGLAAWLTLRPDPVMPLVLLGMAALAIVSWLDDRRGGLPVGIRLGAQMLSAGLVLAVLPSDYTVAQGLVPVWLERVVLFLAWIWFTNLFNFMDGINGITGIEMTSIGAGYTLVSLAQNAEGVAPAGLIVAAAALGFLPWNWGRAKVFLGDVGSVPVGYLLGALLLALALSGAWAAALILPMYYWIDATYTLLRRLLRGEKIWQAHRSHFYQQGARKLGSHAAVSGRIAALNLVLIALALASTQSWQVALAALVVALAATAGLCRYFAEPV
ncbi:MAG: glycosyltransferase family 4 protein [Ferrovibrio sp.]|uniref:MraY family glycosyltransferase n=1 Tax=Ferrovibrio sp. TaxID=1917215 RepID=UPI002608B36C|nr:glycosyltransferase family 4 protein [Ferrovibrio sp.]MCW0232309.1 glycosyltransferase family 4 protein [Ferrovibrio sp.]